MSRAFTFDLFRLNIEDHNDLFTDTHAPRLRSDDEIKELLKIATDSAQDEIQETRTAVFKWSLREYIDVSNEVQQERSLIYMVLARSVLEKEGLIVTDDGLSSGKSSSHPPLASAAICLFDLSRHLVAVEHTSELSQTAWKDFIEKIMANAAHKMGLWSTIILEPVPEKFGIVGLLLSFDRLTRMRVTLRIPNPELNRYTQSLYDDLSKSSVREITQDMKNPNGMSKSEDARPYACAVLAEQGYKKGEVQFEGVRNENFEKASSGSIAARGNVRNLKEFVRGLSVNLRTKEAKNALDAICVEIDRIHPLVKDND